MKPAIWRIFRNGRWSYSDSPSTRSEERAAWQPLYAQPEADFSKAGFGKSQGEEGCAGCGKQALEGWALYCVKCSEREWVGLTDEEIKSLLWEARVDNLAFARAIEAILKTKNII